eukprot:scaffold96573_cov52-Attheya_sp.AAC.2
MPGRNLVGNLERRLLKLCMKFVFCPPADPERNNYRAEQDTVSRPSGLSCFLYCKRPTNTSSSALIATITPRVTDS